jgi:hypothetical protein
MRVSTATLGVALVGGLLCCGALGVRGLPRREAWSTCS